jgi:hypothetical protein
MKVLVKKLIISLTLEKLEKSELETQTRVRQRVKISKQNCLASEAPMMKAAKMFRYPD